MARYIVRVRTPKSPAEAFSYMADLRNFAEWDPGVARVKQIDGDGAGLDASFDVDVKVPGRPLTLRYRTTAFDDESTRMTAYAKSVMFSSEDVITVEADDEGTIVTYDAELKLNGLLALWDPILKLSFNRIGDRAANGLITALAGERLPALVG
ncbi:MAG: SRPBCC family protein [Ilumatobacter sp.]